MASVNGPNGSSPPAKRKGWTLRVSSAFLARKDISTGAKLVALAVCSFANERGEAYPTSTQIGEACAMNDQTVDRLLLELRAAGVFCWESWRDEHRQKRRRFLLAVTADSGPQRLFIAPTGWDGLGGKDGDGRRTMQHPSPEIER